MPVEDFIKAEGKLFPSCRNVSFKDYYRKAKENNKDKWQELTIDVNREVVKRRLQYLIESGSQGVGHDSKII